MRGLVPALLAILFAATLPASAETYSQERDVSSLRLGQKVLVDDGTCPAGQIKQLSGARLVAGGVEAVRQCVPLKVRR